MKWMNSPFTGNMLETVRNSHWPITWPIYLPCTMAQGQSHCASNIISNSHPFHSKWVDPPFLSYSNFNILPSKPKVKVMGEVKVWSHNVSLKSINSHPFRSMSIGHPIPEIWFFQNLTLKIQGQGHGRGENCKSQHGSNILLTHIPFVPCQSAIPFKR